MKYAEPIRATGLPTQRSGEVILRSPWHPGSPDRVLRAPWPPCWRPGAPSGDRTGSRKDFRGVLVGVDQDGCHGRPAIVADFERDFGGLFESLAEDHAGDDGFADPLADVADLLDGGASGHFGSFGGGELHVHIIDTERGYVK